MKLSMYHFLFSLIYTYFQKLLWYQHSDAKINNKGLYKIPN
nr:MAG TPA: hypothetical protein [Crassvirales sp.]